MNILQKNVINKCFGALAVLACVAGLSACGGGGGNPGTVPGAATGGSTVVSKAAKVELVASSATILSSGDVSVTLKATAKDAGNNGLAGETLAFTTSAKGTVSNVTLKTDASGNVAA
ncbi:MAG TPA: Ig domain-containing protein, partial [Janthinobacterium sp.]|nr:Ig domain-containing protein [Janthinobacterium sp.]